jgi:bifunctional non-homologous end joining protein LigD
VLDGEAVILGVDGISGFNALHSGKYNEEVQLCAFDLLAMDGDDMRDLPLSMRRPILHGYWRGALKGSLSAATLNCRIYSARPASLALKA